MRTICMPEMVFRVVAATTFMPLAVCLNFQPTRANAQHAAPDSEPAASGISAPDRLNDPEFQARAKYYDELDSQFMACFPSAARDLLETSSGEPYSDGEIRRRAGSLKNAFDDPVDMLVATCNAFGVRSNDEWSFLSESDLVLFAAVEDVDIDDYLSAISRIDADEKAMLGAARLLFDPSVYFIERLDTTEWKQLVPKLATVAIVDGNHGNGMHVIDAVSMSERPAATTLLRNIACGEVLDSHEPIRRLVSVRETAFLALAGRNDQTVKNAVRVRLGDTLNQPDRAALEVCMALLGDPNYLSSSHFQIRSRRVELAALKAIGKYSGEHGIDVLIYSALSRPSLVRDEAAILLQRLSGQQWLPAETVQHSRAYADDAANWWKKHPQAFVQPWVDHEN